MGHKSSHITCYWYPKTITILSRCGNICLRSSQIKSSQVCPNLVVTTICSELAFGHPCYEWDALDRIAFAWLVPKGPSRISLVNIVSNNRWLAALENLVNGLSLVKPVDIVNLMKKR
jgi:hypothetical protein